MPLRRGRTKVMEPLEWAFPPPEVPDREVRARLSDSDDGRPPLLFVHGLGHGAWCFDEHWMPAAAAQGWGTYALSLRGHGQSGGEQLLRRATLRDYAHDVLQVIAQLPAPPVLVGHSMGALIVQRVLERYTAAPAAVLLCPTGHRHGLGVAGKLARHRPAQLARGLIGRPVRLDGRALVSDEVSAEVAEAYAGRLGPESPLAQHQIVLPRRRRMATSPVLVLGGGDDELVPPVDVVRVARHYGSRPLLFTGMGHDLMLEARWRQPLQSMLGWLDLLLRDSGQSAA